MAGGGNYESVVSQMPSNLQGQQQPPGGMDYIQQARGSGLGGMVGGMFRQLGYEQGRGPFAHLANEPGGFFGYGGGMGGGRPNQTQHVANYMQMGNQYGQLGPYNTMARDMASGNLGQFGMVGGNPYYQGGMHPSGRVGAWGRPQSALSQFGYGGMGIGGRGGGGRQTGAWPGTGFQANGMRYPGVGQGPSAQFPAGAYGMGPSGQDYFGGFRGNFTPNAAWNPFGRQPGVNPTSTPWGGVSNRHPLSSFLRLPGRQGGAGPAQTPTGDMQASDAAGLLNPQTGKPYFSQGDTEIATTNPVNPMLGGNSWISGGGHPGPMGGGWQQRMAQQAAPLYASDAWRRQATGVQLPFQLPASAQSQGMLRSQFLY